MCACSFVCVCFKSTNCCVGSSDRGTVSQANREGAVCARAVCAPEWCTLLFSCEVRRLWRWGLGLGERERRERERRGIETTGYEPFALDDQQIHQAMLGVRDQSCGGDRPRAVCALEWWTLLFSCVCVCACVFAFVCACACVYECVRQIDKSLRGKWRQGHGSSGKQGGSSVCARRVCPGVVHPPFLLRLLSRQQWLRLGGDVRHRHQVI